MNMMKKAQQGFTLIELMIVVAIIGILAAIAIPAYQDYVVKSQASSALAEITPAKTQFEVVLNQGGTPSLNASDGGYIGIGSTTTYCNVSLLASNGGIECTTKGGNATKFNGKKITLTRNSEGMWSCTSTLDAKYRPQGCGAGTT